MKGVYEHNNKVMSYPSTGMYETILVATDSSKEARAALDHAIGLAASVDAVVHVVTVLDTSTSSMSFGIGDVEKLNEAATELVEEIVEAHGTRGVDVTGDVRRGKPATVLLDYADEVGADLIVAGQRGEDGVTGAILGSTTDRLARLTDIPLIIVPASDTESE